MVRIRESVKFSYMRASEKKATNLVDQYLNACVSTESAKASLKMLDYELKADPIEKKLIKRIKEQVEQGKIVLSMRSKEKV